MATEQDLVLARARARSAWHRAAEAAKRSARFQALAATASPTLRDLYLSLAESSRRAAEMHGASARLQTAWAEQIERFGSRVSPTVSMPGFLAAVADVIGAGSAAVVVWGREHEIAAAMATDVKSRAAVDVELLVGEGPAHATATEGRPVAARAAELASRWPVFAHATATMPLGVVATAPLKSGGRPIGALTVFDPPWDKVEDHLGDLQSVAGAVVESLTEEFAPRDETPQEGSAGLSQSSLLVEDWTAVVHQAAGMVATQAHCDPATALVLIKARAFAEGVPCAELAARIVARELTLAL
jgi:hypothetical protein